MVWSVKYRKKILTPEIESFMQTVVQEVARDHGFTVHLFEVGERDHVHCFVTAPPTKSISIIAKQLKGTLARKTFEAFHELRNGLSKGVMWNHSYYVETVGSVSEDAIRTYIENQTNAR